MNREQVQVVHGDLLEGLEGPFDLIAANPPYVREGGRRGPQSEVRDHEPAAALFGDTDGLGLIRRLITQAPARLRPGGYFVFEFGFGQDEFVENLVAGS